MILPPSPNFSLFYWPPVLTNPNINIRRWAIITIRVSINLTLNLSRYFRRSKKLQEALLSWNRSLKPLVYFRFCLVKVNIFINNSNKWGRYDLCYNKTYIPEIWIQVNNSNKSRALYNNFSHKTIKRDSFAFVECSGTKVNRPLDKRSLWISHVVNTMWWRFCSNH